MAVHYVVLMILFCCGCHFASIDEQAERLHQQLYDELVMIHTMDDIIAHQDSLTILFMSYARLAIEQQAQGKAHISISSYALEEQWRRVLAIPGARTCFERYQEPALQHLDDMLSTTMGRK